MIPGRLILDFQRMAAARSRATDESNSSHILLVIAAGLLCQYAIVKNHEG